MSESNSCLVAQLRHYYDIDDESEKLLARLEKHEKKFGPRERVFTEGDETQHLFVVKYGWFYSATDLEDGSRLLVRIHHPGDILGFSGLAFHNQALDLYCCTEGCLCPFGKEDLDLIVKNAPSLTALLFTISAREQVVFTDRLRATSRMNAQPRIAYFLLDLLCRLRITNSTMTNRFRLPLTQTEIGDAVGLTNVSVSRAMTTMEKKGLFERADGHVTIKEEQKLIELCSFEDRYSNMDTSWFPK